MYRFLSTSAEWLARWTALAGGIVLTGLIVMTCLSITGRTLVPLGLQPIPGDFELIEIGVGFAVFAFLPWCQLKRGHATVDLFQPLYGRYGNRFIDVISDVIMFIAAYIIASRLYLGMLDKLRYDETTFILRAPVWMAYAAGLFGAAVFVYVSAFCILRSLRVLMDKHDVQH